MLSKYFLVILTVAILNPVFGETTEHALFDVEAESNLEIKEFDKSNVLGIFDRIGLSNSNEDYESSNRIVVRVSSSHNELFEHRHIKPIYFAEPGQKESIEIFPSPVKLSLKFVSPWHPTSLITLNSGYHEANCQELDLIEPYKSGGLVETYFEAECEGIGLGPFDWKVTLTLTTPNKNTNWNFA